MKGFTLIEAIVVVAIIGIVASVVLTIAFNPPKPSACSISETSSECLKEEKDFCEIYSYSTIANMPAKCLKFFAPANSVLNVGR